MTAAKRLGLAGVAVASLGASAAYYAGRVASEGYAIPHLKVNPLVGGAVAAVAALMLLFFWRSVLRSVKAIGGQLGQMASSGNVEPITATCGPELRQVTQPLNELLTALKAEIERSKTENRELEIHSRIASAEKHNTEAIIFSISDAVIVTNRFDELILANEAAQKLLGFELSGSLRKNIDRITTDGTLVRLVRETRSHGRSFTRRVVEHTIDQNNTLRTFSITLSCVVTSTEEVVGVVAVLHDVTREKEIARIKTDFVSGVSHELKTPLASIKAYVEMLIDGEAEDEKTRHEFCEIIASEADRLNRLIENILNISRIESGLVKVVKEPVSLTAIARQVLDVATVQAKAKNIRIVDRLAPVYCQVEADQDLIYQAVMNLISNGVKYTPEGGTVTVDVSVDERRKMVALAVIDTGAGIPAADLPHIFDKFYRVGANRKLAKGTGLGLTLVKHVIETTHGGKLSVTSEKGKGSTFSFELPVMA